MTQVCVPKHGGPLCGSCGRIMEEMHLISASRTGGHDVVYCLKIFAAAAGAKHSGRTTLVRERVFNC